MGARFFSCSRLTVWEGPTLSHADGGVMADAAVEGKLGQGLHDGGRALPILLPAGFDLALGNQGEAHGSREARGRPAGALGKFPTRGVDRRHLVDQDAVARELRPKLMHLHRLGGEGVPFFFLIRSVVSLIP